ncbi:hypothetical protein [Caminibacter sp.]
MKLTLGDIIFGFADIFKSQAGVIEEILNSKINEIEKRLKRLIVFFAGIVIFIFGIFFLGEAIFEYFKISGAGAYLVAALFFFFVSFLVFFASKFIK